MLEKSSTILQECLARHTGIHGMMTAAIWTTTEFLFLLGNQTTFLDIFCVCHRECRDQSFCGYVTTWKRPKASPQFPPHNCEQQSLVVRDVYFRQRMPISVVNYRACWEPSAMTTAIFLIWDSVDSLMDWMVFPSRLSCREKCNLEKSVSSYRVMGE